MEREVGIKDVIATYFNPQGTTFPYMFWLRIVNYLKTNYGRACAVIPYLFLKHYEWKYDIHVNTNIRIGKGLLIVHGGGVYLNCAVVGDNFTVYQGVTLGTPKYGEKYEKSIPSIMNNVTIYSGAVVCGSIVIGNNARIGANAFVNKTIEDNQTFVCANGRLLG